MCPLNLPTYLCLSTAGACQSPLHNAAARGDTDIVGLLLASGAAIDAVDENGAPRYPPPATRHPPPATPAPSLCNPRTVIV